MNAEESKTPNGDGANRSALPTANDAPAVNENLAAARVFPPADDAARLRASRETASERQSPEDDDFQAIWGEDGGSMPDWRDEDFYAAPTVEYDGRSIAQCAINKQFAIAACFFSPGNGAFYADRPFIGIAENIGLSLLFVGLLAAAMHWSIFPIGFIGVWIVLLIGVLAANVSKIAASESRKLRRANVLGAFFLALSTFWLPFIFCFYVSSTQIVQRTWMSNDTMAPTIARGDALFVNKRAFSHAAPGYGDVVLVEDTLKENGNARRRAFFGRIIARPGDTVQLIGARPYVNGKALAQAIVLPRGAGAGAIPDMAYELPHSVPIPERPDIEPSRWYPIKPPSKLHLSQTNALRLDSDYYYVLEDNRDIFRERIRNSYGAIVHRSEIKGKPIFILYNTDAEDIWVWLGFAVR